MFPAPALPPSPQHVLARVTRVVQLLGARPDHIAPLKVGTDVCPRLSVGGVLDLGNVGPIHIVRPERRPLYRAVEGRAPARLDLSGRRGLYFPGDGRSL